MLSLQCRVVIAERRLNLNSLGTRISTERSLKSINGILYKYETCCLDLIQHGTDWHQGTLSNSKAAGTLSPL